jgi:hypothetical protein
MVRLSSKQINDVAQELDAGLKCYVNKDSGEYKSILDLDHMDDSEGYWQEELEKIQAEWSNYVVIEKPSTHLEFGIMEGFAASIENEEIRDRLFYALSRNKPFRNFRNEVDYREDIRQRWFAFKQKAYEDYVREELVGDFLFE